jgi:hypothetical protein
LCSQISQSVCGDYIHSATAVGVQETACRASFGTQGIRADCCGWAGDIHSAAGMMGRTERITSIAFFQLPLGLLSTYPLQDFARFATRTATGINRWPASGFL